MELSRVFEFCTNSLLAFPAHSIHRYPHMKSLSLLLAAVVIAFSLPACASAKKKECCSGSSCSAPDGKNVVGHVHKHKSS